MATKHTFQQPQKFTPKGRLTQTSTGGGGGSSSDGPLSGLPYVYSVGAISDLANAGTIRMNDTVAADVTTITLGQLDLNNEDQEAYLDLFTSGIMRMHYGTGLCVIFKVNRMINKLGTDNYFEFTVQHISGSLPTDLSTVRMDAQMDAPGVRRLVASVGMSFGGVWAEVHQNSLKELPSVSVLGNQIIISSTGSFELNKCHGTGSAVNESNDGAVVVGFTESGSVDDVYFFVSGTTNGSVNIYLQVYN